ncbi:fimbrial protein [Klebsiella aerogenes]
MRKFFLIISSLTVIIISLLFNLSLAACSFNSGATYNITMSLPSTLTKPTNSYIGTVLWSSGWVKTGGGVSSVSCNNSGEWTMGDLESVITSKGKSIGFNDVFNTTVPGVGIRIYYCKDSTCGAPPSGAYMGKAITGTVESKTPFESYIGPGPFPNINSQYYVELIATSGKIGSGVINLSNQVASSYYGALKTSRLLLSGTSSIKGSSCTVNSDSKSISVRLPPAERKNFTQDSNVVYNLNKAQTFNINLTCEKDLIISYRIDATPAAPNVISNASGDGMAQGVGLQLFKGDHSSTTIQSLGAWENLSATSTTMNSEAVSIPFTVRYYRTAASPDDITSGRVSAIATFSLLYL